MPNNRTPAEELLMRYITEVFPAYQAHQRMPSPETLATLKAVLDPWCRHAISVLTQYSSENHELKARVTALERLVESLEAAIGVELK
jgi:hypothetical protein